MTVQRIIRILEESPTDPNVSASVVEQSGSGKSWGMINQVWTVGLDNGNPNSKTITFKFLNDFRKTNSTYNIPADRCIVRYKARPAFTLQQSYGLGVSGISTYSSSFFGNQVYSYITAPSYGLNDIVQTGSAVTTKTPNQQPITTDNCALSLQYNTSNNNSNGLHQLVLSLNPQPEIIGNTGLAGSLFFEWEADHIIIDGLDGDTLVIDPVQTTLSALGGFRFFSGATLATTSTISAEVLVKKFVLPVAVNVASSIDIISQLIQDTTKELTVQTDILASTENLVRLDPLTLSSNFTQAVAPTFKPSTGVLLINTTTTASLLGNMIYDVTGNYNWDSFNLNSYFQQGFIAPEDAADQGEYTWEFLSTDTWDDWATITWVGNESSWDNWPDNIWERVFTLPIISTVAVQPSFKLGDVLTYTGAFTFAEQSAFEKASAFDVDSAFITSFTASGLIDAEADISSAFAPGLTANIIFDSAEAIITGAFAPVLTANAITDIFADIDIAFGLSVAPTFKPSAYQTQLLVTTDVDIAPTFKPSAYQVELSALASTLSVIRLFYAADPYNIWTIDPETRVIVVLEENRRASVLQENRLNTIEAEMRNYLVPQETRNLKLRVAPFKNRFSIPKVRAEQ